MSMLSGIFTVQYQCDLQYSARPPSTETPTTLPRSTLESPRFVQGDSGLDCTGFTTTRSPGLSLLFSAATGPTFSTYPDTSCPRMRGPFPVGVPRELFP